MLHSPQPPPTETILAVLINEIATPREYFLLAKHGESSPRNIYGKLNTNNRTQAA